MNDHPESRQSEQSDPENFFSDLLARLKGEIKEAQGSRFAQWNFFIGMPSSLDPIEPSDASPRRNFYAPSSAHSSWNDRQHSPCARSLRKERAELIHRLRPGQPEPLPDLSSSDFLIQVRFTVDVALELGIAALELSSVRKVLSALEAVVVNNAFDMSLRKTARNLLQELFKAMMPASPLFLLKEASIAGQWRRFAMLEYYEEARKKIGAISKRRSPGLRLQELRETFPDIPEDRLKDWCSLKPERFAREITAYHFKSITTPETVRQLLQQARKEREDLEAREKRDEEVRARIREEPEDDEELAREAAESERQHREYMRRDPVMRLLMDYGLSEF